MVRTLLFDLDGTLLPMDQDEFLKVYFGRLVRMVANEQVDGQALMGAMNKGVVAMAANDGAESNEQIFRRVFTNALGEERAASCLPAFDRFYETEFDRVASVAHPDPKIPAMIRTLKDRGCRLALATSPMFPLLAVEKRLRWAGLDPADFDLITTYENAYHSKPNPLYYADILRVMGCEATDCLMVGNDVDEDMTAGDIGIQVFLLTDYLINRSGRDIAAYPHGGLDDLIQYLDGVCAGAQTAPGPDSSHGDAANSEGV